MEGYTFLWCPVMRGAGEKHDADVVRRLEGGFEERGQKKLDEEGVAEMVDAKLHLVAVCG